MKSTWVWVVAAVIVLAIIGLWWYGNTASTTGMSASQMQQMASTTSTTGITASTSAGVQY